MNKSTLVSIIIPVYNGEKYLKESIESAINQSWENLEIIVIDDGSRDKSWEIIEGYKKTHPQIIKTCKQEHQGASKARNKALEISKGDYIQYLDADDLLKHNKIEGQLRLLSGRENTIASCSWGKFTFNAEESIIRKKTIDKSYDNSIEWLIDSWTGGGVGCVHMWLTPRKIISQSGGWNENINLNDDGDFFCRVLLKAKEIIYCPDTIIYYRDTDNSLGKRFTYEACESMLRSYENYVAYLSGKLDYPRIKNALACNFSSFYSYVYPNFPDLLSRAEKNVHKIGLDHFPPIGGRNFRLLSKLMGVKRATQIRYKI